MKTAKERREYYSKVEIQLKMEETKMNECPRSMRRSKPIGQPQANQPVKPRTQIRLESFPGFVQTQRLTS